MEGTEETAEGEAVKGEEMVADETVEEMEAESMGEEAVGTGEKEPEESGDGTEEVEDGNSPSDTGDEDEEILKTLLSMPESDL